MKKDKNNSDEFMTKLKESYKELQIDRYKYFGLYKCDRWLFQVAMISILGYLFFIAYSENFDLDYYVCSDRMGYEPDFYGIIPDNLGVEQQCRNPFYQEITWKNLEVLPPGEYGKHPDDTLYSTAWPATLGIIAFVLLLNHVLYNRKKLQWT